MFSIIGEQLITFNLDTFTKRTSHTFGNTHKRSCKHQSSTLPSLTFNLQEHTPIMPSPLGNINWSELINNSDCGQTIRDLARTKLAEQETAKNHAPNKISLDPIWGRKQSKPMKGLQADHFYRTKSWSRLLQKSCCTMNIAMASQV